MVTKASENDFNFIYSLYMHPSINPYLLYEPMDTVEFKPIYENLIQSSLLYVFEHDSKPTGMFKLVPFTHRSSHVVYLGGLAIDPAVTGKGLGGKMMAAIIDHCKQKGFLRIELSVAINNEKAIRLYERAGFKKEGVLRKYTHLKKQDIFIDEVLYSYLIN